MIAYEEYVVKGFELDVNDYRIKPVSFERFRKAIDKNVDYLSAKVAGEEFADKPDYFLSKHRNWMLSSGFAGLWVKF